MGWFSNLFRDNAAPAISDELAGFSKDEIDSAALLLVHRHLPHVYDSYLDGTISHVKEARRIIETLRQEHASLVPKRLRQAVMKWLDWHSRKIDRAEQDIISQKSKRELDEYRKKNDVHFGRVDELLDRVRKK